MKRAFFTFLAFIVLLIAAGAIISEQRKNMNSLRAEAERYRHNTEVLTGDIETYRVRDSLNGARVEALELTQKEWERWRAEDAALIRELQSKGRGLQSVIDEQSRTILALSAIPRDTVIVIRDSIKVPAVAVHCGDAWYDFNGILTETDFKGRVECRDSLVVTEAVEYKRFLGFLWRTRKVKARTLDIVSRNPHTEILGVEYIKIEK